VIFVSMGHLIAFVAAALVAGILLGRWVWTEECVDDGQECEEGCEACQDSQS
jgi:hypothetical protein